MQFSAHEIHWAKPLHDLGLPWEPRPGHFVWDHAGCIEQPSPFQEGVVPGREPDHRGFERLERAGLAQKMFQIQDEVDALLEG